MAGRFGKSQGNNGIFLDNRENRVIVVGKFTGKRVGIIGGFGAYATLDFYGRLLDSFAVEL